MAYYTRNGGIFGDFTLSTNSSALYDLQSNRLYPYSDFAPITFTNAGALYSYGPTLAQCQAAYAGQEFLDYLSVNYGYQSYVVQTSGTYRFTVAGAAGGVWTNSPMPTSLSSQCPTLEGYPRLPGAKVIAEIYLTALVDTITIVVGQGGGDDTNTVANCPGGGGGTFVTKGEFTRVQNRTDELLFVAGGGGGAGYNSGDNPNISFSAGIGQSGTSGGAGGGTAEAGGTNGYGAPSSQSSSNSGGGGGYLSGPGNDTSSGFSDSPYNSDAYGFRYGAHGGTFTASSRGYGGFGCGGHGAATTSSDDDKGGGGGYSGGGYAFDAAAHGGGGGSYVSPSASNVQITAGGNTTSRHGYVIMELI